MTLSLKELVASIRGRKRKGPRPFRYAVLQYDTSKAVFAKAYSKEIASEYERGRRMWEIGERTGFFRAPRPLGLIEEHGIVLWEYLGDLIEMRDFLTQDLRQRPKAKQERTLIFQASGRALAALHEGFPRRSGSSALFPFQTISTGNSELDLHAARNLEGGRMCPLHWDFVCGNLFVSSLQERGRDLIILDCAPNHYIPREGDADVLAPVYVDLGLLVFSLYCHRRFSPSIAAEVDAYREAFLRGYQEQAAFTIDRATVLASAAQIVQTYWRFRQRSRQKLTLSDRLDERFWARSYERLTSAALESLKEC